jgi:hypothetical protein
MSVFRVQLSFPFDTALPRDRITINPHYSGDNAEALADNLMTAVKAITTVGAARSFGLKVYDAEKAPPSYPLAERVNGTGFTASTRPREIACCLSYYAQANRPSQRGRMYIPGQFISGSFDLRPSSTQRLQVAEWATALDINQPNTAWVLWSRKLRLAMPVTDWWVDDEWDVVRSRGLRPTTRESGEARARAAAA